MMLTTVTRKVSAMTILLMISIFLWSGKKVMFQRPWKIKSTPSRTWEQERERAASRSEFEECFHRRSAPFIVSPHSIEGERSEKILDHGEREKAKERGKEFTCVSLTEWTCIPWKRRRSRLKEKRCARRGNYKRRVERKKERCHCICRPGTCRYICLFDSLSLLIHTWDICECMGVWVRVCVCE